MMNDILAHNVRRCFSFEEAIDRFRDSEPELSSREDQCHVGDANASAQRSKGPISGSVTVRPYNQFPRQNHTSLGEDLMRNPSVKIQPILKTLFTGECSALLVSLRHLDGRCRRPMIEQSYDSLLIPNMIRPCLAEDLCDSTRHPERFMHHRTIDIRFHKLPWADTTVVGVTGKNLLRYCHAQSYLSPDGWLSRRPVLFKNSDAGFYSFPWARGPWVADSL